MSFEIAGRVIGVDEPMYVIAEMSANHLGDIGRAREIVHAAAQAGADAVKLQTYTPDTMTLSIDDPRFTVAEGSLWERRHLYDLYQEAMTPWLWHAELMDLSHALGMTCFSSPFDITAVDFLAGLNVPAYKIASFEIVDLPLIRHAAERGRPLVISTGMASQDEIGAAVRTAQDAGAPAVALLRCNSAYPAPPEQMDLRTIPDMAERFDVPVGLSDHTLGTTAAVVARTLGACILEKHLTLRREEGGPDSAFSLEPDEFATMVAAVREAEASLGAVRYGPAPSETPNIAFRRSLFVVADVHAGDVFTMDNVRALRPGDGLPPAELDQILGRRAAADIRRGTPLAWELVAAG